MVGVARMSVALMATAMAVAGAPPAAADQGEYLGMLLPKYAYLNSQQLMTEAGKACSIANSGRPASDAVPVVVKDLGVSVSAAGEIVAAALVYLHC